MDSEFLSRLNPKPQSPLLHYKKKENLNRIETHEFSYNFCNDTKFLDSIDTQVDSRFIPSRNSTAEMKTFFFSPLTTQKKSPSTPDGIPSTYDTATQPLKKIEKMFYDQKQSPIRATSPSGIDQRRCSILSNNSPNYSRRRRPQIDDRSIVQRFPSEQIVGLSSQTDSMASTVLLSSHPSELSLNSLNSQQSETSTPAEPVIQKPGISESPIIQPSSLQSSCEVVQSNESNVLDSLHRELVQAAAKIAVEEPILSDTTSTTTSNDHSTPKSQRYRDFDHPIKSPQYSFEASPDDASQQLGLEDLNDELIPYLGNSFEEDEEEGNETKSVLADISNFESFLTSLQQPEIRPLATEDDASSTGPIYDSAVPMTEGSLYSSPPRGHIPDRFEQTNPEMQPECPSYEPTYDLRAEDTSFYHQLLKGELISSAKLFSKPNDRKTIKSPLSRMTQKISRDKMSKRNDRNIDSDPMGSLKKDFNMEYDSSTPFSIQSFSPLKRELYSRGCTIPRIPFKIIEADSLIDDFYLNLVDWGRKNLIAIGLGDTVHLWNSSNGKTMELGEIHKKFVDFDGDEKAAKKKNQKQKHHKKKSLSLGSFEQLVQESLNTDYEDESVSSLYRSFCLDSEELDEDFIMEEVHEELESEEKPSTPPKNPESILSSDNFVSPRPKFSKAKKSLYPSLGSSDSKGVPVTSVGWSKTGEILAVGKKNGLTELYDVETGKKVRELTGHKGRVGCVSWNDYSTFSTGSRDHTIIHRDQRIPTDTAAISKLISHTQEVCGLRWSPNGKYLASGGNDNRLCVWDFSGKTSSTTKDTLFSFLAHEAAVKGIDWSPFTPGLLVTGGGTQDKCIRFWDISNPSTLPTTTTGENSVGVGSFHTVYTGSQVCNIRWSLTSPNELVSTHGYSQNQIIVWAYPWMKEIAILTGHTQRVLYLTLSPDGQYVATGAGDKTLRIWRLCDKGKSNEIFADKEIR